MKTGKEIRNSIIDLKEFEQTNMNLMQKQLVHIYVLKLRTLYWCLHESICKNVYDRRQGNIVHLDI